MKEFFKWLGVNEKVAKLVIWIAFILLALIITNTALESIGLPFYKITVDNLTKISISEITDYLLACVIAILNFYSTVLLVFKINRIKTLTIYAIVYLMVNIVVMTIFDYGILQIFIIGYILLFCYFFSGKKWKYVFYGIIAFLINALAQYITYTYKMQFIDYKLINELTRTILSMDYFIIMAIIILVKEIYLKKRGEKNGQTG